MIRSIYRCLTDFWRRPLLGITLALWGAGVPVYSQSALPVQVRVDLLRQKIFTASRHHDFKTVVTATEQYKALGVAMPPVFLFVEATAEYRLGDSVNAFLTLQAFLAAASRTSRSYREAIHLYPSYQRAAQMRADVQARAAATQALERAIAAYQAHEFVRALVTLQGVVKAAPKGSPEYHRADSLLAQYQAAAQQAVRAQNKAKHDAQVNAERAYSEAMETASECSQGFARATGGQLRKNCKINLDVEVCIQHAQDDEMSAAVKLAAAGGPDFTGDVSQAQRANEQNESTFEACWAISH